MNASEIAAKHRTPRADRMLRYLSYIDGTQYDGRWPFLQESDDAPPLLERAPCIVYPVTANAIRSHADFVMGEGRWPTVRPSGMDEDAADRLGTTLRELECVARTQVVCREAFEDALATGTAVAIVCVRDGEYEIETVLAAWCTPKFASRRIVELEIRYPYIDTYFDAQSGKYVDRCMLYRRVIDAQSDTVFESQPAPESGEAPRSWTPAETVPHGLGFCPVIWYAALAKHRTVAEVDGHPIHEHLLDEIDALNFALSQRHRAALLCGDPLRWEAGVERDALPGAMGRDAHTHVEVTQDGKGPHPKGTFRFTGRPRGNVRKLGAGAIWSSENEGYKVGMLTLPGDALAAIDEHAKDLKAKIHESFGIVDLDVENAKLAADMSGKAQEIARQRQVDRDNMYRQDFGDKFIVPLYRMLMQIGKVDGADKMHLDLAWGPYFPGTAADQKAIVELCDAAIQAKLVTRRIAIEKLKSEGVFAIDSADAVASEPTLDDAKLLADVGLKSATFDSIYKLRLAMSLLGECEPATLTAIEKEIESGAAAKQDASDAMLDIAAKAKPAESDDDDAGDENPDAAEKKDAAAKEPTPIFRYDLEYKIATINERRAQLGLPPVANGDRPPDPPGAPAPIEPTE